MVPRLSDLAAQACAQNVALLDDVGDTPFHILRPVLARMSARQLDHIEGKSPHLVPHTDLLWPHLTQRDFPNRPLTSRLPTSTTTPHKALYNKYLQERESLQRDSAQRLRSMTQRLRQEKSANAITPVKHLLRDPTIRRRRSGGLQTLTQSWASLSIVQRARREALQRLQMFRNSGRETRTPLRPLPAMPRGAPQPYARNPVSPAKCVQAAPPEANSANPPSIPTEHKPPSAASAQQLDAKLSASLLPRKRPSSVFLSRPKRPAPKSTPGKKKIHQVDPVASATQDAAPKDMQTERSKIFSIPNE